MDEAIESFLDGCKLAKFLEASLPNMVNQPELLISSCDEIIRVFGKAKENISKAQVVVLPELHHASQQLEIAAGVQEWLRNSRTQAMDFPHDEQIYAQVQLLPPDAKLKETAGGVGGLEEMVVGQMGCGVGQRPLESGREIELPAVEAVSSRGGGASNSQRQRRRGGGGERRVEKVAAPRMGNTEIPPEDGYTWRKYGQKDILYSRFPRSYFRCTHQKLYQCPAKKQVQRLDNDPNTFEVTYRGDHTCHLSSTAPSVAPPPPVELRHADTMTRQSTAAAIHPLPSSPTTTVSMSQWLSMDISMHRDFGLSVAGGGAAGPSAIVDYQLPVADMADAMFNSRSSSSNSMDLIFSSMDDKWPDSGDKKN